MADITELQFLSGFGDDTLVSGMFDPLPSGVNPAEVLAKVITAYKAGQTAYNAENTDQITVIGEPTLGDYITENNGSVSQQVVYPVKYKKNFSFDDYIAN